MIVQGMSGRVTRWLALLQVALATTPATRRRRCFGMRPIGLIFFAVLLSCSAWGQRLNGHQLPALDTTNIFTAPNQFSMGVILGPQFFSQLGNSDANGSQTYCLDCQVSTPCASGGTGAFAQRIGGAWQCSGGGGGGGGGGTNPGGSTTQLQFNNAGFFGGSPNLTWVSPTLIVGQGGVTTGLLGLASGNGGTTLLEASATAGGTAMFPNNTGTVAETNLAQSWTGNQTFSALLVSNGTQTAQFSLAALGGNRIYTIPDSGGNDTFAMRSGTVTTGNCAKFDANGNVVDFGMPCGGSGAAPGTPLNSLQFNSGGSFGGDAGLTWISPTLTIGSPGAATGQLSLAGASGGQVTLTASALAGGTWFFRNANDNVVGAATADSFSNKTFDTASNSFLVSGIAVTGKQGNSGLVQFSTGTPISNDCVKFDAGGNTVDSGAPCATASAAGSANQIQFNLNGSALGASPALTFVAPALTVGQAGVSTGILGLTGATSGTTSLTPAATAGGTWTLRNATDNVVGAATADVFTNKTYDTAAAGNVLKVNGTQLSAVTGTGAVVLATSPTIGTSLTVGGTSNQLAFSGNVNRTTLSIGNPAAARTYTLPDSGGNNSIALTAGVLVNGHCAKFDANGNLIDTGSACGSTTPGGLTTQVQFNSTGSFAGSANLTWTSPTLTIGAAGAATGNLALAGATSGSVTITTVVAAGGTATFPNATGTVLEANSSFISGQLAIASGAATLTGSAGLTWVSPTLTVPGNLTASGIIATGAAGGPGTISLPGSTATPTLGTNVVELLGPTVATFSSYALRFSSSAPGGSSGVLIAGAPVSGISAVTYGSVPKALGGTGVADAAYSGTTDIACSVLSPVVNGLVKFDIDNNCVPSAITDDGTTIRANENLDLVSQALLVEVANASGGTSNNHVAIYTGAPASQAVTPTTSYTGDVIGVVQAGAATTGSAEIARGGQGACSFDGSTTAGDYVQLSNTITSASPVAGDCHDSGATRPAAGGPIMGHVLATNTGAGTYEVMFDSPDLQASPYRVCNMLVGGNNQTIGNGDVGPQYFQCPIPYAATVREMDVIADQGTPTVSVVRNRAGVRVTLTASNLSTGAVGAKACANGAGAGTGVMGGTCTAVLQNTTLAAGDYLELGTGGTASTAHVISVTLLFTVN